MDQVSLHTMHRILMKNKFSDECKKKKKLFRLDDGWKEIKKEKTSKFIDVFCFVVVVEIVVIGETYNGEKILNIKLIN